MFLDIEKKQPNKVAAQDSFGNSITYGEIAEIARSVNNLDLTRGVALCMCKNTVGALVGYISLVEAGIVPIMISDKIDEILLYNLMDIYKPQYICVDSKKRGTFLGEIVFENRGFCLLRTNNEVYAINEKLQLLMTTSGTTGSPKLVRYKIGNLESNAKNVAKAFGWTEKERPLCDLGMQYTMGLNVINTHLYVGATAILTTDNIISGEYWDTVKNEGVTNFTGVPFSYDILRRLHFFNMDLPDLTTLAEGGGKLTDKVFAQFAEYAKNSGKRFIATFGTTETSARMSMLSPELACEKIGSIGRAIPEGELFLRDSDGRIIEETEAQGELGYKGPNVTMGYAVCKEDLRKDDEWNGVYYTGDLAKRDQDGCYYIVGRMSRFLKLLSYRVSLDECERIISSKYNIECACAGDDKCMDIYITNEELVNDILDYISSVTGLYKNLFKIHVIEAIPRSETGKICYSRII